MDDGPANRSTISPSGVISQLDTPIRYVTEEAEAEEWEASPPSPPLPPPTLSSRRFFSSARREVDSSLPALENIEWNSLDTIPGLSCSCVPPPPPNARCVLPVPQRQGHPHPCPLTLTPQVIDRRPPPPASTNDGRLFSQRHPPLTRQRVGVNGRENHTATVACTPSVPQRKRAPPFLRRAISVYKTSGYNAISRTSG